MRTDWLENSVLDFSSQQQSSTQVEEELPEKDVSFDLEEELTVIEEVKPLEKEFSVIEEVKPLGDAP